MKFPVSFSIITKFEKDITPLVKLGQSYFDQILIMVHKDDLKHKPQNPIFSHKSVKIITHHIQNDFAQIRNLSHRHAKHQYLFFVDSDEEVVISNPSMFNDFFQNLSSDVYFVKRYEHFLGKLFKHSESIFHARIVKKNIYWQGLVHETPTNYQTHAKAKGFYLIHHKNLSIHDFINQLNYYSGLRAKQLHLQGHKGKIIKIAVYPLAKFIQNFIWRLGFLEGWVGLFQAFLMAYYSLITQVKLYLYKYD